MKPIVIEQDPAEIRMAVEVHQSTSISRIRLVRAKLTAHAIEFDEATTASQAPISVDFSFRSKALDAPSNVVRVEVAFKMSGTQNEKTAVTVECAYAADYTIIRDGFVPSSEQAKAFREGNAIFNLWPYFREYLQSSLLKMGLPALTAPFLCLRPKAPQGGASPQSKGSAGGKSLPKTGKR